MKRLNLYLFTLTLGPALSLAAVEEFLPTPYTAEEIREASGASIETLSKTTTPQGVTYSLDRISIKNSEVASFSSQPVDESLSPQGEPSQGEASWEQLRRHALFPSDRASRVRTTRKTALGELEGWLYTVRQKDDSTSTFFFADLYPGSPVLFFHEKDGELLLRVEMLERRPISPNS